MAALFKKSKTDKNNPAFSEAAVLELDTRKIPKVKVDPSQGLTEALVAERVHAELVNTPVDANTHTVKEIIKENTLTYFNLVFVILALLLLLVGSFRNMLFMGVIVCNTLIGIVQGIRAKKVLDGLKILNAPHAKVVREGKILEIPTEELVLDDIIVLGAGDQIPADAIVVAGSVQVNEALLTGEADEITKSFHENLMSGSFVISGSCRAQLTQVGAESYISQLTLQATRQKGGEQSEMMRSLDRLVQAVGIIIIPIGILLFSQQYFIVHNTFRDSITGMVAAVIGMIPEGLYLTASLALAVSAMRLARQQVMLHDMKCIETLARVTVLCVDKTGTITEEHMEVKEYIPIETLIPPEPSPGRVTAVLKSGEESFREQYQEIKDGTFLGGAYFEKVTLPEARNKKEEASSIGSADSMPAMTAGAAMATEHVMTTESAMATEHVMTTESAMATGAVMTTESVITTGAAMTSEHVMTTESAMATKPVMTTESAMATKPAMAIESEDTERKIPEVSRKPYESLKAAFMGAKDKECGGSPADADISKQEKLVTDSGPVGDIALKAGISKQEAHVAGLDLAGDIASKTGISKQEVHVAGLDLARDIASKTGISKQEVHVAGLGLARDFASKTGISKQEALVRGSDLTGDNTSKTVVTGNKTSGKDSAGNTSSIIQDSRKILCDLVQGMDADNITMKAMKDYFLDGDGLVPEKIIPFSSSYKYSGGILNGRSYVLGAPEFVLKEDYGKYKEIIENRGKDGYRVLAFGEYPGLLNGGALTQPVRLLGLVLLANKIRAGAVDTFRYFAERDVRIKVISGDNPVSVSAIAKEAGIQGAEHYVDAATLKTEAEMAEAMKKYTVFGRVTPEQKRQFVAVLKGQGETVAMTGDGVNDVLALKDADCSIAMASGSEAATQVSQLVLLDSDFSRMPSVVMEGRRVVNNIERTASLFLVKNIFSLLLAVSSVLLMLNYPIEASQLSLITTFTIGIPAFLLSQEPNGNPIRGHFLANVLLRALPAGLTDFAVVLGLVIFCQTFGVDSECMSTACTLLLALVGFMIMYRIMHPMTWLHWAIWILMLLGFLVGLIGMPWFYGIQSITMRVAMLMVVFGMLAEPMMRYLGMLTSWIEEKISKKSGR